MKTTAEPWKMGLMVLAMAALVGGVFHYVSSGTGSGGEFSIFPNEKKATSGTLIVEVDIDDPESLAGAAAFAPASTTRNTGVGYSIPLIFNSGGPLTDAVRHFPDRQRLDAGDYGSSASGISASVASEFWTRPRTIVVVDEYEDALRAGPLATLLDAPLLYDGAACDDYIGDNDVLTAVTVGDVGGLDIPTKALRTPWSLYDFQLRLMESRDLKADYILVANPEDIYAADERLDIPGLSLASTALACQRSALVIAGDFTVDINMTQSLGYGTGEAGAGERGADPDETTDAVEREYQLAVNGKAAAVDNAIDEMASHLSDNGYPRPSYVCLVGGAAAVPQLYIKSPVWFENVQQDEKGEEYLATEHYYGDLDVVLVDENHIDNNYGHMKEELYHQELAVGRVIGSDLLDASALAARSLHYWDVEFDRMPRAARAQAVILESLACGTADTGASTNQQAMFATDGLMAAKAYTPKEISAGEGVAPGTGKGVVLQHMEECNAIVYDGHGYPDGWFYTWTSTHDNEVDYDRIGYEDARELDLYACPVFAGACLTSALDWPKCWATSDNALDPFTPDKFMSLAFIHAGAMCYIGATEESWGAFFGALLDEQPDRWGFGAFDLPTMFWENLFQGEAMGAALAGAKERFYGLEWTSPDGRPFARTCILECVLYGDPAATNGNPTNRGLL